ncbi:Adenylyl cyclase class-3/4/guanylyl cyclase [Pseudocohnilembus persalinus]|uniref:Adenylyl cyclase class-3/4/guanylyl cyclase n=1 Tax=Pseudocohnilembus persalinus TaxID=266149 RepID=A0A0V0R2K0_PSEPJ|nr:Adenylyl cyclase class-3/4/guanylyl cyclase [Pseudocohnilembus persalinus]|eukprot:KRX08496.1 Adenylyl cyclase class-3/4/guanylyl cyclase [Pseudocohnilembus persalinus]
MNSDQNSKQDNSVKRSVGRKKNTVKISAGKSPVEHGRSQDGVPAGQSSIRSEKILTKWEKTKLQLLNMLEHNITSIIMTIFTIYALFGDDIRILTTDKYGDPYFWVINIVTMVAFTLEIIVSSLAKEGYWNGFFFWLDIISTISLLLDIGWVSNELFNGSSTAASAASLARAGRASRIGTKAGRIIRIIRLIRLVKLYKVGLNKMMEEDLDQDQLQDDDIQIVNQSSAVQSKLIERDIRKKKAHNDASPMAPVGGAQSTLMPQNKISRQPQKNTTSITQVNQKSMSKLPPLGQGGQQIFQQQQPGNTIIIPLQNRSTEAQDGPSKPVVLDKYKNDPLLMPKVNEAYLTVGKSSDFQRIHPLKSGDIYKNSDGKTPVGRSELISTTNVQKILQKENNQGVQLQETKVGQKLSELTTKRVISLVLSILFSVPIFSSSTWSEDTTSYNQGLYSIYVFKDDAQLFKSAMESYIDFHKDLRSPIIYIEFESDDVPSQYDIYPKDYGKSDEIVDYEELRSEEVTIYSIPVNTSNQDEVIAYSVMDGRKDNDLNAILSIIRTVFISVVLSLGALAFQRDVEQLVLEPIENMVQKVQRIADNPLEAAQMEENEAFLVYEMEKNNNMKDIRKKKEEQRMETAILEKLIIKIGALLAVGFGEAGSQIIAKNMKKGGAVDPMLPGQKIMAIFGFCDIRNFTDATEVLQTNVMVFVNEIAEITHGCVDQFCGQSNKNIGDAFLLVWKYQENQYKKETGGKLSLLNNKVVKRFSDLPVLAFLKIMQHLAVCKKLHKYKDNAGLNKRIPGYNKQGVRMGFGLHQGWAIEGAIGSEFKIDASYLSPNVNMASRLEAATKQFGTGLLISGPLYQTLTEQLQKQLRHIDRVTVKGSIEPLDLYTVDVSYDLLIKYMQKHRKVDKFDIQYKNNDQKKKRKIIERIKRNKRRTELESGKLQIAKLFDTDQELILMRKIFTTSFYEQWKVAFQLYLDGSWEKALQKLEVSYTYLQDQGFLDGPAQTLIGVIKEHGGKAPSNWNGFRALTEK